MFTAAQKAPFAYQPPWNVSVKDRLSALVAKERRVVYFYESPDSSSFRYRVFNMAEALNAAPQLGISASWFTLDDAEYVDRFIERADALIICRVRYDARVGRILTRARARGMKILFDVDDLVFNIEYVHLILDTLAISVEAQASWNNWFALVSRLEATLRLCDEAIVTNDYLARRVVEMLPHMRTSVVPNFLNRQQQEVSGEIWRHKRESGCQRTNEFHLGYFSGTSSHSRDFAIAAFALSKILAGDKTLILRIVGLLDREELRDLPQDRIEVFPLQDFLNLQRLIGEVELNLTPLQENRFTNCKSELKYFEAAVTGTLTVASPTYAFRKAIRDGENGFLANGGEWVAKIQSAIEAIRGTKGCPEILERGRRDAIERYGWNVYSEQIAAAIFGESAVRSAPSSSGSPAY